MKVLSLHPVAHEKLSLDFLPGVALCSLCRSIFAVLFLNIIRGCGVLTGGPDSQYVGFMTICRENVLCEVAHIYLVISFRHCGACH